MIITRTPFRVSFFGGGTDIPAWYLEEGGQVLSTTIDKYCYVTARTLPPFFDHSIRIAYSKIETVTDPASIIHPLIRAVLLDRKDNNLEIHYDADIPGRSGIGSSSSFGVGLLSALEGLQGGSPSKKNLAEKTIFYEREVLKEDGGHQDQIAAAYGGLNHIKFNQDGSFTVEPLILPAERLNQLQNSLLLCYIPLKRFSGDVSLARNFHKKKSEKSLREMFDSVSTAIKILKSGELDDFGHLMDLMWHRKRSFSGVSNSIIDEVYNEAKSAGAIGGKLLGAGGGGFMIFCCPQHKQAAVKRALRNYLFVPFAFESSGSQIIYSQES